MKCGHGGTPAQVVLENLGENACLGIVQAECNGNTGNASKARHTGRESPGEVCPATKRHACRAHTKCGYKNGGKWVGRGNAMAGHGGRKHGNKMVRLQVRRNGKP